MNDSSQHLAGLAWSAADLLRGDFKRSEYSRIILMFTVLRRLDCMLDSANDDFAPDQAFGNTSGLTLPTIKDSPKESFDLLRRYIAGFSPNAQELLDRFDLDDYVKRLEQARVLPAVVDQFASLDLGPSVTNAEMSDVFDELVRRFAGASDEAAGEHFTPPDVVKLMAALLLAPDTERLAASGGQVSVLDPVCGTGGLLNEVDERIKGMNPHAGVNLCGQEISAETWAICRSNLMLGGKQTANVAFGNTLTDDGYPEARFDYLIGNPPSGVDWRRNADVIRRERDYFGFAGRFGAGLPRINDGSFLFLQHMLAKMKSADESAVGGSRVAVMFNGSPLSVGAAESGESNIRRWIIKNDWLETIVALPDQLLHNTSIDTYLWILTNRKSAAQTGQVVLLNAREHWERVRSPVGSKRKYFGPDQINELVDLYGASLAIGRDERHPLHKRVRVLRNDELAYRQITIERPLRLRYELSSDSLTRLGEARPFQAASDRIGLLTVFRTLIGTSWDTSAAALSALREAARAAGHTWPKSAAFERSVRKAVGVRDGAGEIQRKGDEAEPDPVLRESVQLPLDDDPQDYLRREVHPETPDAWIDDSKTKQGYEIRSAHFFVARLNARFDQLRQFARVEPQRTNPSQSDEDPIDGLPLLGAQDLHLVDSAADLPPGRSTNLPVSVCGAGDLVGRQGSWRLLPQGFGEAVTTLFVLHPLRGTGRGLCEWLNSREVTQRILSTRDLRDLLVPADLVDDEEVDDLLEVVHNGRRAMRAATSGFLPNAFASAETTVQGLRTEVRSAAYEARLIGDLMGPLEDPVWRAEWSYPYHIAALARRYRIATHPAERKDGLLKLGEGIARTLGTLALSEIVAAGGFSNGLRKSFRTGATFGTWTTLVRRFAEETGTPRVRELTSLREHNDPLALLESIREFRNDSQHAHGIRASHELDADVEKLEPRVVSAINSVKWLAGTPWDWVERCEYLDESSYKLVGLRLRGSHPNWEPFERVSTTPLKPDRVYVAGTRSGAPADLWPLAAVLVCPECRTRELFLLNQVRDDVLTLRSLEEHSVEIIERRQSGDAVDFVLGGLGSGEDG